MEGFEIIKFYVIKFKFLRESVFHFTSYANLKGFQKLEAVVLEDLENFPQLLSIRQCSSREIKIGLNTRHFTEIALQISINSWLKTLATKCRNLVVFDPTQEIKASRKYTLFFELFDSKDYVVREQACSHFQSVVA